MAFPKTIGVLASLVLVAAGLAQDSGIQGVLTDVTGRVIPGARAIAGNTATGVEYSAESNENGFYSVPFLSPVT